MKSFYVIDGSSYIYRAFYALGRLSNSKGLPTQAVLGFLQMLQKVLREKNPDYICVVFDAAGPTFRHEIYPEYKGTRQKMPEDLVVQVPYIKRLVACHGLPQLEQEGLEADDLIAALVRRAASEGVTTVIVSGDKDLHQLVCDPLVSQWDPQRDRIFREADVQEKFGVTPGQMRDYLSLVGDSSDNVPGVKGVGEKTARDLLQRWVSLDAVLDHVAEITPPGLRKKLQEGLDMASLSRRLISFREDVSVPESLEAFVPGGPRSEELLALYEELEFRKHAQQLREEGVVAEDSGSKRGGDVPPVCPRCDCRITNRAELNRLLKRLEEAGWFTVKVDTNSTGTPSEEQGAGIALSCGEGEAWYVPLNPATGRDGPAFPTAEALETLAPLFARSDVEKCGHDIKSAWVLLKRHGIDLSGIAFDTMVGSYLLDPGKNAHTPSRVALEYLGHSLASEEESKSTPTAAQGDAGKGTPPWMASCEEAEAVWRLVPVLRRHLLENGMEGLYDTLERPLIPILAALEYRGILVDSARLESLSVGFEKSLDAAAARIFELTGEEFNIQSPKQLSVILFDKLGLRVVKKTKSGPSTDVSVLEELAPDHPVVEYILTHRSLAKLKGTYADALPRLVNPSTGRIHTSFNQTVAATGRLSSSNPNLQNIPIRLEEGRRIREAFIPAPGHVFLSADYSQIELRILAHYSQDAHLVESFREGEDVHRRTAAEMLGIPPQEVTPEMRRQAKTINFGIIYGMGSFGLAKRLRIGNKTAKAAIDRYFERYDGVRRCLDRLVREAREKGYSETLLGRRRAIPELSSRNFTVRQQGERLAVNTPIQGTAADLIKKAMIDVDRVLREHGLKTAMLLQVHDELVFEVPRDELEHAGTLVRDAMEGVWELTVPLVVDMGWGANWAEAHP